MKKLSLIFLLLGSVLLAGCGDNEDEAPSLIRSSPAVDQRDYYGTELSLTFNSEMLLSSINLNSVYVINPATKIMWPVVSSDEAGTCGEVEFAFDDTVPVGINKQIVNIDIFASGCMLPSNTDLVLVVTRGVSSILGVALDKEYRIPFKTGNFGAEPGPPTVVGTSPVDGSENVSKTADITVTFSKIMDGTTLNSANVTLQCAPPSGVKTVISNLSIYKRDYDSGGFKSMVIDPWSELPGSNICTVTLTGAGIKDLDGNAMPSDEVFSFTVAP